MQDYYCGFFSLDSESNHRRSWTYALYKNFRHWYFANNNEQTLIDVFDDGEKKIASIRNFFKPVLGKAPAENNSFYPPDWAIDHFVLI